MDGTGHHEAAGAQACISAADALDEDSALPDLAAVWKSLADFVNRQLPPLEQQLPAGEQQLMPGSGTQPPGFQQAAGHDSTSPTAHEGPHATVALRPAVLKQEPVAHHIKQEPGVVGAVDTLLGIHAGALTDASTGGTAPGLPVPTAVPNSAAPNTEPALMGIHVARPVGMDAGLQGVSVTEQAAQLASDGVNAGLQGGSTTQQEAQQASDAAGTTKQAAQAAVAGDITHAASLVRCSPGVPATAAAAQRTVGGRGAAVPMTAANALAVVHAAEPRLASVLEPTTAAQVTDIVAEAGALAGSAGDVTGAVAVNASAYDATTHANTSAAAAASSPAPDLALKAAAPRSQGHHRGNQQQQHQQDGQRPGQLAQAGATSAVLLAKVPGGSPQSDKVAAGSYTAGGARLTAAGARPAVSPGSVVPAGAIQHAHATQHADATQHGGATQHADATQHGGATQRADATQHAGAAPPPDAAQTTDVAQPAAHLGPNRAGALAVADAAAVQSAPESEAVQLAVQAISAPAAGSATAVPAPESAAVCVAPEHVLVRVNNQSRQCSAYAMWYNPSEYFSKKLQDQKAAVDVQLEECMADGRPAKLGILPKQLHELFANACAMPAIEQEQSVRLCHHITVNGCVVPKGSKLTEVYQLAKDSDCKQDNQRGTEQQQQRYKRGIGQRVCGNCGTTEASQWHRDKETGTFVCQACYMYKWTYGRARPPHLHQRGANASHADPPVTRSQAQKRALEVPAAGEQSDVQQHQSHKRIRLGGASDNAWPANCVAGGLGTLQQQDAEHAGQLQQTCLQGCLWDTPQQVQQQQEQLHAAVQNGTINTVTQVPQVGLVQSTSSVPSQQDQQVVSTTACEPMMPAHTQQLLQDARQSVAVTAGNMDAPVTVAAPLGCSQRTFAAAGSSECQTSSEEEEEEEEGEGEEEGLGEEEQQDEAGEGEGEEEGSETGTDIAAVVNERAAASMEQQGTRRRCRQQHRQRMQRVCTNCGTASTSHWCKDKEGDGFTCDSCYRYQGRHGCACPSHVLLRAANASHADAAQPDTPATEESDDEHQLQNVCTNCGSTRTGQRWCRDKETGSCVCQACYMYQWRHGCARPYRTIQAAAQRQLQRVCSNCGVTETSQWCTDKRTCSCVCHTCYDYQRRTGRTRPYRTNQKDGSSTQAAADAVRPDPPVTKSQAQKRPLEVPAAGEQSDVQQHQSHKRIRLGGVSENVLPADCAAGGHGAVQQEGQEHAGALQHNSQQGCHGDMQQQVQQLPLAVQNGQMKAVMLLPQVDQYATCSKDPAAAGVDQQRTTYAQTGIAVGAAGAAGAADEVTVAAAAAMEVDSTHAALQQPDDVTPADAVYTGLAGMSGGADQDAAEPGTAMDADNVLQAQVPANKLQEMLSLTLQSQGIASAALGEQRATHQQLGHQQQLQQVATTQHAIGTATAAMHTQAASNPPTCEKKLPRSLHSAAAAAMVPADSQQLKDSVPSAAAAEAAVVLPRNQQLQVSIRTPVAVVAAGSDQQPDSHQQGHPTPAGAAYMAGAADAVMETDNILQADNTVSKPQHVSTLGTTGVSALQRQVPVAALCEQEPAIAATSCLHLTQHSTGSDLPADLLQFLPALPTDDETPLSSQFVTKATCGISKLLKAVGKAEWQCAAVRALYAAFKTEEGRHSFQSTVYPMLLGAAQAGERDLVVALIDSAPSKLFQHLLQYTTQNRRSGVSPVAESYCNQPRPKPAAGMLEG